MKKLVVKKVQPVYPELAREARIVGRVGLKVVITPQGDLGKVQLIYGHPILAPAAMDAVRKWKFRPYILEGQPVEAEGEIEFKIPY
jgi:TonB family protein